VHDGPGEFATRAVPLAHVSIAVAATSCEQPGADALAKGLAGPRPDALELHLGSDALDERHRGVHRVLEGDLLAGGVVEESNAVVAHQLAHDEGGVDGIAAEARVVAADDDVAGPDLGDQPVEGRAPGEVIARMPSSMYSRLESHAIG
jgi:hypothetical protein